MNPLVSDKIFVIDQSRCIGCEACVQACEECGTHRGQLDDPPRVRRPRREHADRADGVHALRGPDLRRGLPGRRDQAERGRRRAVGAEAALHRLLELRARLPVRRAEVLRPPGPDDEVRHVLRPHVASGSSPMCASVCPSQALWFGTPDEFAANRAGELLDEFRFGNQVVPTKVATVVHDAPPVRSTCSAPPSADRGRTTRSASASHGAMSAPEPGPDDATPPPMWRDDFPLTRQGEDDVTRREFVRYLARRSGVLAAGERRGRARGRRSERQHGRAPAHRRPRPGARRHEHLFRYPTDEDPAILVHLPGGDLRAFSQKCTHLGCVVFYEPDARTDLLSLPRRRLRPRHRRVLRRTAAAAARPDRGRGARRHDLGAGIARMSASTRRRDSARRRPCSSTSWFCSRCRSSCSPSRSRASSPTIPGRHGRRQRSRCSCSRARSAPLVPSR